MDDLISRQAAIKAIEQLNIPEDMCVFEILSHVELAITTLPSTERKGKWIKYANMDSWRCSECMKDNCYAFSWNSKTGEYDELQDKFCPNCGARMEQ